MLAPLRRPITRPLDPVASARSTVGYATVAGRRRLVEGGTSGWAQDDPGRRWSAAHLPRPEPPCQRRCQCAWLRRTQGCALSPIQHCGGGSVSSQIANRVGRHRIPGYHLNGRRMMSHLLGVALCGLLKAMLSSMTVPDDTGSFAGFSRSSVTISRPPFQILLRSSFMKDTVNSSPAQRR
jgi:hypothetical protein